tara:strand:+ start:2943 stop:4259 length:1317 start_codon:yes stop_codon:yes gene_type:complete
MQKINISTKLEEVINNINNQKFTEALKALKLLSKEFPKDNLINKMFATVYFKTMDWNNAIKFYEKILPFEKEKFKILTNIGVAFFNLGKILKSIESYNRAIKDNSKFDLAYSNLGISYLEVGNYEYALNNFVLAMNLNKKNFYAQKNLITLFNLIRPNNVNDHPLIDINNEISKIGSNYQIQDLNKIENIKKILQKSNNIIKTFDNSLFINETQIYRKNSTNLNCKRHFRIFNKFKIIPRFCFSCYKVQINLENIVDLIKLYFLFDNLNLENNNIRKCIVEMRTNIKGNYKGYIYCNGLEEAEKILEKIKRKLYLAEIKNTKITIKHGCSEYYKLYPKYEKINFNGAQEMQYDQTWEKIENIVDNQDLQRLDSDQKIWSASNKGINLSDILIIKNWINYADTIGDHSYKLIYEEKIENNFMNKILKPQLDFRKEELFE